MICGESICKRLQYRFRAFLINESFPSIWMSSYQKIIDRYHFSQCMQKFLKEYLTTPYYKQPYF